ncbi:hypothetical protein MKW92_029322 [Papaver armeniacum]|nr:hypothetical protein MKW92_029322 [Papaver armeniacum]
MRSSRVAADVSVEVLSSPGAEQKTLSSPVVHRDECSIFVETAEVGTKEVIDHIIEVGIDQNCLEDAAQACEYQYHSSGDGCYDADQCHCPCCWKNRNQDRIPVMVLTIISLLLTFSAVGGFSFTQTLATVGRQNQVLKHSLVVFNVLFVASFLCNFLAVLILLILQPRRQYSRYKKISLFISNTASFAFLILGYGFVIAFNIQHR